MLTATVNRASFLASVFLFVASSRERTPTKTLTQPITALTARGLESSPSTGNRLILVSAGWIRFHTYLIVQTASWQKAWEITEKKKGRPRPRDFEVWMMSFLKDTQTDRKRQTVCQPARQSHKGQILLSDCSLLLVTDRNEREWKSEVQREKRGNNSRDKTRV